MTPVGFGVGVVFSFFLSLCSLLDLTVSVPTKGSHNDNFLGQAEVDLTKLERDVRYPRWLRHVACTVAIFSLLLVLKH